MMLHHVTAGRFAAVSNADWQHVPVFAVQTPTGKLQLVAIDVDDPAKLGRTRVTIHLDKRYSRASFVGLQAAGFSSTGGETLGGGTVKPNGTFTGAKSTAVPIAGGKTVTVELAAGSAKIITVN